VRAFEDLPRDWQDRIRALAAQAPPLSTRQRERLQILFSAADLAVDPNEPEADAS
jgi:hypothetical protein